MNHTSRPFIGRRSRALLVATLTVAAPFGLLACGSDDESADETTTTAAAEASVPTVTEVWARPGTAGGNSAVYMVIQGGDEDAELVKASLDAGVAERVELHETTSASSDTGSSGSASSDSMGGDAMEGASGDETTTTMAGGMMSMKQVESIPIPAGEKVELKPGGYHVMLIGLEKDLAAGEQLPMTLTFEPGGTVEVTAEVKEP